MNDSVILNADAYLVFLKKVFFIRETRHYPMKEVIISPPVYHEIALKIDELNEDIDRYLKNYKSMSYKTYWFDKGHDQQYAALRNSLDAMLNSLGNSTSREVLNKAEEYPVLITNFRPFKAGSVGAKTFAYIFPVGLVMRLISLVFDKRINRELLKVKKLNNELQLITERL